MRIKAAIVSMTATMSRRAEERIREVAQMITKSGGTTCSRNSWQNLIKRRMVSSGRVVVPDGLTMMVIGRMTVGRMRLGRAKTLGKKTVGATTRAAKVGQTNPEVKTGGRIIVGRKMAVRMMLGRHKILCQTALDAVPRTAD